jgi:hypothetical protein
MQTGSKRVQLDRDKLYVYPSCKGIAMILSGLLNQEFIKPLQQLKLQPGEGYLIAPVDPA